VTAVTSANQKTVTYQRTKQNARRQIKDAINVLEMSKIMYR